MAVEFERVGYGRWTFAVLCSLLWPPGEWRKANRDFVRTTENRAWLVCVHQVPLPLSLRVYQHASPSRIRCVKRKLDGMTRSIYSEPKKNPQIWHGNPLTGRWRVHIHITMHTTSGTGCTRDHTRKHEARCTTT
jgi:hypothetical protein